MQRSVVRLVRLCLTAVVGFFVACDGTEPPRPTTIEIVSAPANGSVGATVDPSPTFRVLDQNGDVMTGVTVSVVVATGGGTLTGAPAASTAEPIPVGQWKLGQQAGVNELEIRVEGITPVRITVAALAGPPAQFIVTDTTSLQGQVATAITTTRTARLADQFGNPVANATVTIAFNGGTAPTTLTSGADGSVALSGIVLGQTSGTYALTLTSGAATYTISVVARPGPVTSLAVVSGNAQSAVAGSTVPQPVRIAARDQFGNNVPGVSMTFTVLEGNGFLRASSATTGADGIATAPAWTLGITVAPQRLRATSGTFTADVTATIATSFDIDVQFFGSAIPAARQAKFTDAANRIRAIVTGDLPAVAASGITPSDCGVSGVSSPIGTIDDVLIYAAVQNIDGQGNVLASAGPCYLRSGGGLTVVGVMQFDSSDIASLEANQIFDDVIMHEMLHILGIGIGLYWQPYLSGKGTSAVAYAGPAAVAGCRAVGGTTVCATAVPVENSGGAGTADSHWRESTFQSELMTGYSGLNMPFSRITIGGLEDIGYVVNYLAADSYTVPGTGLRAGSATPSVEIDHVIQPRFLIDRSGRVQKIERAGDPAFPNP